MTTTTTQAQTCRFHGAVAIRLGNVGLDTTPFNQPSPGVRSVHPKPSSRLEDLSHPYARTCIHAGRHTRAHTYHTHTTYTRCRTHAPAASTQTHLSENAWLFTLCLRYGLSGLYPPARLFIQSPIHLLFQSARDSFAVHSYVSHGVHLSSFPLCLAFASVNFEMYPR